MSERDKNVHSTTLHIQMARLVFPFLERDDFCEGCVVELVRKMIPTLTELDARYGVGWEHRDPFTDAFHELLEVLDAGLCDVHREQLGKADQN